MKTKNWEKRRGKGVVHYTLFHGVLLKGGITSVLFSAVAPSFLGEGVSFMDVLPTALVAFPLACGIINAIMWPVNEWNYRNTVVTENHTESRRYIFRSFRKAA